MDRVEIAAMAEIIAAHLEATSKGENVSAKNLLLQLREKVRFLVPRG